SVVYDGDPSSLPWLYIGVSFGVLVLLLVLSVVAVVCYRKRRSQETPRGKDEQIPLLSRGTPFYKTSTFHEACEFLKNDGKILCFIGKWGSGKSATAKQVYKSFTGREPVVIEDILNFDVSTCQDSVIVEEPFPSDDIPDVERSDILKKLISLCKQTQRTNEIKTFLIITSTDEAWENIAKEMHNCSFTKNELHSFGLNWKDMSNSERIQILHTIFEAYKPDTPSSTVEKVVSGFKDQYVGFPEICTLFFKCSEFQKHAVVFFGRPLRYLASHLEKMCLDSNKKEQFLLLVYMSVNDMKIDINKSDHKLREIYASCGLNNIDLKSLLPPEELVVKENSSVYVLQHGIIKRMSLITFGKFYFSELLKFSSRKDLLGWIKRKNTTFMAPLVKGAKEASEMEPVLEINNEHWIEYLKKIESVAKPTVEVKCKDEIPQKIRTSEICTLEGHS
ncbi:uncharacterized protein LOC134281334, partial [Saccostrea cucullata]|uniref:uncharacterized protein LOC134281334 n=1 Tax=Saccostrea cuccullata TaxID=36930 RepID=UPI002ED35EBE